MATSERPCKSSAAGLPGLFRVVKTRTRAKDGVMAQSYDCIPLRLAAFGGVVIVLRHGRVGAQPLETEAPISVLFNSPTFG